MPWDFWLIFLVLGALLPWRGYERMKHFMALPEVTGRDRVKLYLATIVFQWLLTLVVGWRAFARGLTFQDLALANASSVSVLLAAIAGAAVIGAGHWANVRRMSRSDHPNLARLRALGSRLFPRTPLQTALFILLAVTAGICEEFLFRGFVMAVLLRVGLATWLVVILSSAMFGIAHIYQGRGGSVGTGILGLLLATFRIAYHSLLPPVLWHAVLDIVAGIAGARFLLPAAKPEEEVFEEIHR